MGRNNLEDIEIEIDDEDDDDEVPSHVEFEIATYPSDLTLSVIHEMWKNGEITIPSFQRNFVWNIRQSSLLIESFLLGLPVPQVFFYIDVDNINLVIDGQQRILSVVFYFEGYFGSENLQGRRQVFRLTGLSKGSPYAGKRFEDLTQAEQRKLRNSVLRAVNIRQLAPANQNTSMYHIFERLNTGGTPLRPQEIRNCVFHGELVNVLHQLNDEPFWRKILARKVRDRHQRDVEMILRVLAMRERGDQYEKPMKGFLNNQMEAWKNGHTGDVQQFAADFRKVLGVIVAALPEKPFHVRGPINLAAMDSVLSVLLRHLDKVPPDLSKRYQALFLDKAYQNAIFFNTSDAATVKERLKLAKQYLID